MTRMADDKAVPQALAPSGRVPKVQNTLSVQQHATTNPRTTCAARSARIVQPVASHKSSKATIGEACIYLELAIIRVKTAWATGQAQGCLHQLQPASSKRRGSDLCERQQTHAGPSRQRRCLFSGTCPKKCAPRRFALVNRTVVSSQSLALRMSAGRGGIACTAHKPWSLLHGFGRLAGLHSRWHQQGQQQQVSADKEDAVDPTSLFWTPQHW